MRPTGYFQIYLKEIFPAIPPAALPLRFYAKNPGRNTRNGLGSKAKRPEKAI